MCSIHSLIGTISPVLQANEMNLSGAVNPISGWRQRIGASAPRIAPLWLAEPNKRGGQKLPRLILS